MSNEPAIKYSYFNTEKHSPLQVFLFVAIIFFGLIMTIYFALPFLSDFFVKYLHGVVYNDGTVKSYFIEGKNETESTSYFFNWAVDVYKGSPNETRYWFNPFMILVIESSLIGLFFSIFVTSLLPVKLGLLRHKIDRELASVIDRIEYVRYGYHSKDGQNDVINEILNVVDNNIHDFVEQWNINLEDLKVLIKALKWRNGDFLYKIIHINDGLQIYMRFHFTIKYSNAVLGFVYMGAAFLIVIIGLRGLKFIPPTEPSFVLFALGLEFTILVVYAITLIYTKQEEESDLDIKRKDSDILLMNQDYGSAKDIERLLRVFIKSDVKSWKNNDELE